MLISPTAQQLLCARISGVVQTPIRCCADGTQLLCSKKYREEDKWYFYGNV